MKTRLTSVLVLAASLSALFSASLTAAPQTATAHALRVRTADNNGWEITRGTPARTLVNRFGAPDAKFSDQVWVYHRFHAVQKDAQGFGCDILVITLADDAITDIHLVNDRAQEIITARLQSAHAPALVAATE